MTRPAQLPEASFAPVITRRLARPMLLWQDERAAALGFDAERVFASPVPADAPNAYTDETRVQWADRYGGVGVGTAGGSGRCAAFGDLQIKGVGVTSLVAHDGDAHHSSGTQTAPSALAETVFAGVFQAALPYGAVPTLAVLLAQSEDEEDRADGWKRALSVRPFVLRPAHFMRNVFNRDQRAAQGAAAPGLTRDAHRVSLAFQHFTQGLKAALHLSPADDFATIDAGLRELTRRLAWQFAASFAKRLPHGSVTCSNFSLAGEFLDYGMSHFLPTYRRPTDALQDPWTEGQRALHTLRLLRQQLNKYYPGLSGAGVVPAGELSGLYASVMEQRLSIEMAKMAGLTEDLATACPPALLMNWLRAMRGIWLRGGQEPLVPREPGNRELTTPVNPLRPDLNRILIAAAPHSGAEAMDRAITPLLADPDLRHRFVVAAVTVRQALESPLGGSPGPLAAYLATQAQRKNAVLHELERDSWFRIGVVAQMQEQNFQPKAVQSLLARTIGRARHTLSDLAPELPGATGIEQIRWLYRQAAPARTAPELQYLPQSS